MIKKTSKLVACVLLFMLLFLIISPSNVKGESIVTSDWNWQHYKVNDDHCWSGSMYGEGYPYHTDHLAISSNGKVVDFYGHWHNPYFECALTDPQEKTRFIDTELFTFQINESKASFHTMEGTGFVFNADFNESTSTIKKGYLVFYTRDTVDLYKISNLKVPFEAAVLSSDEYGYNLDLSYRTLIKSVEKPKSKIHNISIRATQNSFVFIDNDQELFNAALTPTNSYWFGPAVQWEKHNCSQESHITFTDLTCGVNPSKPVANFSYNTNSAEIRTPVYVTDSSFDTNTPKRALTYFWSVTKKGENGAADTVLWSDKSTPFTRYNASGVGTYITTLKVKNDLGYFSDPVSKAVVITSPPAIKVTPGQDQYTAGNTISFFATGWWNSTPTVNDLILENTVSPNLYNPKIELVGSQHIKNTSGNLNAEISIKYSDGTLFSATLNIPPEGLTVSDPQNNNKEVQIITVTYKTIPVSGGVENNYGITYKYDTSENLVDYYKTGSLPREYVSSNSVTLTADKYSATDIGETTYIEKTSSFKLIGTIDNNGAITEPPACNTEFLITGKTSGGETINMFVPVSNGISNIIELPNGKYTLTEVKSFEKGYDTLSPISLSLDSFGIKVNNQNTIENGGIVSFEKKLQVATINISRECENIRLSPNSVFKVTLRGTPIITDTAVSFDLDSIGDNKKYSYITNEEIRIPIGSYNIKETAHDKNTTLSEISVSDTPVWNKLRNYDPTNPDNIPSVNILAEKGKVIPVVLRYTPEKYVYDEYMYSNSISFSPNTINSNIISADPNQYNYPITLTNVNTNQTYTGLAKINSPITFSYMTPGTYKVTCHNNMFMDIQNLNEVNSDGIVFSKKGDQLFVTVPNTPADASASETQSIRNWRGYSDISAINSELPFKTLYHVGFSIDVKNQNNEPLSNCSFEIEDKNGNILSFKNCAGKIWPATSTENGAFSQFTTNKDGNVSISKIPEGEYKLKFTSIPEDVYVTDTTTFSVDNSMNIGISLKMVDLSKTIAPSEIHLNSITNVINVGGTVFLESKVSPATAYNVLEFRSENSNIATVSNDGHVTGIAEGTTTIVATSKKDPSISCSYVITVSPTNSAVPSDIRLDKGTLNMAKGDTITLNVCSSPSTASSLPIEWESSAPDIVSVTDKGELTANENGLATITAKWGSLEAFCTVTVGTDYIFPSRISLNTSQLELIANHSELSKGKLIAEISPSDVSDSSVTFESSDPNIVSVDVNGNLSALNPGSAIITATTCNGISASCSVSAQDIVESIKLNVSDVTMKNGDSFAITAYLSPSNVLNPELTWTSSDNSVATVNDGFVKLIQEGTAIITAKASYPNTNSVEASCNITVESNEVSPKNIDVSMTNDFNTLTFDAPIEVDIGNSTAFYARVRPIIATDTKIDWSYSIPDLITIEGFDSNYNESNATNKYKITPVGSTGGTVEVTGTVDGHPSVKVSFVVNVIEPSSPISIIKTGPQKLVLGIDSCNSLSAIVTPQSSNSKITDVEWEILPNSGVTLMKNDDIGKDVTLTATNIGLVYVTATAHFKIGPDQTDSFTFEVISPDLASSFDGKSLNLETDDILLITGEEGTFSIEYNFSQNGDSSGFDISSSSTDLILTETSDTASKKTVSMRGTSAGDYSLHIVPSNNKFAPFDIVVHVVDTIPEATNISLTETSISLNVGESVLIHTNIEPNTAKNNIITWTSDHPEFAKVDDNGKITAIAEGVATITATVDDVSATCVVTVTAADTP